MIERFRNQLSVIDLQFEGDPDLIRKAVWSCYQEKATVFKGYNLYDPGAYAAEPLSGKITWRITEPSSAPMSEEERAQKEKILDLIERIKKSNHKAGHPNPENSRNDENAKIQEQNK